MLIVDEGQDFQQPWVAALERLLRPGAAWWWLEDPLQNLYMREPVALPGWTTLKETTNYRSPRDILDYVRDVVGASVPVAAALASGSPFDGSDISLSVYDETKTPPKAASTPPSARSRRRCRSAFASRTSRCCRFAAAKARR